MRQMPLFSGYNLKVDSLCSKAVEKWLKEWSWNSAADRISAPAESAVEQQGGGAALAARASTGNHYRAVVENQREKDDASHRLKG